MQTVMIEFSAKNRAMPHNDTPLIVLSETSYIVLFTPVSVQSIVKLENHLKGFAC